MILFALLAGASLAFLLPLLVGAGGGGGRWHVPGRSHAEMADRRSAA